MHPLIHTNMMKEKITLYMVCLAVILSSATASTPVLDSNGDEVRTGVAYKIFSIIAPGGVPVALKLGSTGNNPCPLDVVLAGFHECFSQPCGLPLTFHPEEGNLVSVSADVNIKFNATTACEESTVLQVVRDESLDRGFVSTGGVLGNQLSASWLRWEAVELLLPYVYKLVYCPRNFTTLVCSNVGFAGNDARLSVLKMDESPFYFTIRKATMTLSTVA